jgi:uncharacterized sulfatase
MLTPNLDSVAERGIMFENAYTTCPVCSPARAGIFSGLFPGKAGPMTNNLPLGSNRRHMGQFFADAGYRTGYIGKWHLDGHDYFDTGICPDGWEPEYWYDGRRYLADLTDEEVTLWRERLKTPADLRAHNIQSAFTWAHRSTDKALDFLDRYAEGPDPFVLVVSYDEPHGPFTCPPEFPDAFTDFDYDLGPGGDDNLEGKPLHHEEWSKAQHNGRPHTRVVRYPMYFGCNSYVDEQMGRVIDAVERTSGDDTWIIVTSDHGDMLGSHRLHSKGPVMYEEITRIPLLVLPPKHLRDADAPQAHIPRNKIVSEPAGHIDILPTVLAIAGIEAPPILDGRDLSEVFKTGTWRASSIAGGGSNAPPATSPADEGVLIEFHRHSLSHDSFGGFVPIRAYVKDRYKLVVNLTYTDELYDLERDPGEVNNLIDSEVHAERREGLLDLMLGHMNRTRDPLRGPCWERRSWRRRRTVGWREAYRMKPDDGNSPTPLVYATGRPETGGSS